MLCNKLNPKLSICKPRPPPPLFQAIIPELYLINLPRSQGFQRLVNPLTIAGIRVQGEWGHTPSGILGSRHDDVRIEQVEQSGQVYNFNHMESETEKLKKGIEEVHTLKVVDGRYSVKDKKLGEGSFAKTYLALDTKSGRVIACKMIEKKNLIEKINMSKNKSLTKEYFINALKNEVKTWKAINHTNIVDFIDFSETQNNIYFFLEFCPGGNLETYLKKNGHIPEAKAIPLLLQLAQGCNYLFDKNIYHRDLKTENILIAQDGTLKLSDFGFAKMVVDQENKHNPTTQTSVGTPIYMSPQIIIGDPYTIKCDVWSLGVVFYKLLYNLYPWEKTDNIVVLINRMKEPIDFPPHIQVSAWLKQLMTQMMTIDEFKRIPIRQVLQTLKAHSSQMEIE